jgi:hypothetical protein
MSLSSDQYTLTTPLPIPEIREKLYNNTLVKDVLVRQRTDKQFIGEVDEDGFYLISSSRIGVICTLKGTFENDGQNSIIEIESKIHRAFIILFACWSIFIIVAPIIAGILNPKQKFSFSLFLLLLIAVVAARFLLHLVYVRSGNRAIKEIKAIIE